MTVGQAPLTDSVRRAYYLHGYAAGYIAARGLVPSAGSLMRPGWFARVFLRRR